MSLDQSQMTEHIDQIDQIDQFDQFENDQPWETQEFYQVQDDQDNSDDYQGAHAQETTCWGCREGILNQLGHMDYGGCLYQDDIIETMSLSGTLDNEDKGEEEQETHEED